MLTQLLMKKSWRVNSLNLRQRNLIHETYKDIPVIRLEYYQHVAHGSYKRLYDSIELALTLGINVVQSDYDVMLGFEDEIQAYNFIRYCTKKRIYAHLYLDEMMISSPGGVELYLRADDKSIKPVTHTSGESIFIKSVKKIRELEKKWRQQWQ